MLKNFKLVHTDGLTGVFHKGRTIPFDKIDDKLAETLIGKTHVLERLAEVALVAGTIEPATAEADAPATSRKRSS
jgi:hypothetical protein